jgi:hypothetical protein
MEHGQLFQLVLFLLQSKFGVLVVVLFIAASVVLVVQPTEQFPLNLVSHIN